MYYYVCYLKKYTDDYVLVGEKQFFQEFFYIRAYCQTFIQNIISQIIESV